MALSLARGFHSALMQLDFALDSHVSPRFDDNDRRKERNVRQTRGALAIVAFVTTSVTWQYPCS